MRVYQLVVAWVCSVEHMIDWQFTVTHRIIASTEQARRGAVVSFSSALV